MKALVTFALLLVPSAAGAAESAQQIALKARERGSFNGLDLVAEMKLVTVAKDGKQKEQVLTTSAKRIKGRVHTLARFSQPAGVAGIAVLSIEGGEGQGDDIALYLPKLKRVRKVSSSERGKAFMDTDFSYSDLGGAQAQNQDLERLADDQVDGRAVFVLRGQGGDQSEYGAVTLYVDQQTYVPLKVEYQDQNGQPLKRYRSLKLKKFKERVVASESSMENLKTGSVTRVEILKLEEAQLGDEAYSERALERG